LTPSSRPPQVVLPSLPALACAHAPVRAPCPQLRARAHSLRQTSVRACPRQRLWGPAGQPPQALHAGAQQSSSSTRSHRSMHTAADEPEPGQGCAPTRLCPRPLVGSDTTSRTTTPLPPGRLCPTAVASNRAATHPVWHWPRDQGGRPHPYVF